MAHPLTEAENWASPISAPDNGTLGNAVAIEQTFQILADRTKLLRGSHRIQAFGHANVADAGEANTAILTTSSTTYVTVTNPQVVLTGLKAGDVVKLSAQANCVVSGAGNAGFYLKLTANNGGFLDVPGARAGSTTNQAGGESAAINGTYVVPTDGNYTFNLRARVLSGSDSLQVYGAASLSAEVLRAI